MVLERARAIVSGGGDDYDDGDVVVVVVDDDDDDDDDDDYDDGSIDLATIHCFSHHLHTSNSFVVTVFTYILHISLLHPAGAASFPTRGEGV